MFFRLFPDISGNALKKLFYNNRMTAYAELLEILKANEIRGYSHYTKSKLIDLLIKKVWYLKICTIKQEKLKKDNDHKYYLLRQIRRKSKESWDTWFRNK